MFSKIIQAIQSFFAALFGGGNSKKITDTKDTSKPNPNEIEIPPQDASEIPVDTVVTNISEDIDIIIDPLEPDQEFDPSTTEEDIAISKQDENIDILVNPIEVEENAPSTDHKPRYMWCLDNGHGMETRGKRSPVYTDDKGTEVQFLEYEFNRDIVAKMIEALEKLGIKYFNVVPEVEIGDFLKGRVDRANQLRSSLPKIYVSIHANAGPASTIQDWTSDSINGIETWYFHGSKRGQKIAGIFQKHLIEATNFKSRGLKSKSKGQFYVIRKTNMTSVLTENGFYNNRFEVKDLMNPEVRQKIADAHVKAIQEIEANGL